MSLPGLARNAVIAASAGTGKTELLTSIYLAHALGLGESSTPTPPARIVATTFSRAAAREIRDRLEQRLSAILGDDDELCARRLGPELRGRAQQKNLSRSELKRRAARVQDELPDATIDTLHNLCARILRDHGLAAGIAPSFAILDEQRAVEDTFGVIDEVLSEALGSGGTLARGAEHLLDAAFGLEQLRMPLLALLSRLDDEGLDATSLDRESIAASAVACQNELRQCCLELARSPESPRAPWARSVLNALDAPPPFPALAEAFAALAAEKKGRNTPGSDALRELLARGRGGNNAERASGLARLISHGPSLDERVEGAALVLGEIQKRLRARHVADSSLSFADLLRLTRDLLRDHPRLALLAGQRVELLLVDEFQDTSRVQCDLLLLLRERRECVLSRPPGTVPRARDLAPRGLVVVGDRKQSIYGFRGADVSVFAELAVALAGAPARTLLDLPIAANSDEPPVAEVATLVDSYRSGGAIVTAVNTISAHDFVAESGQSFEIRYAAAEALRVPESRKAEAQGRFTLLVDDGDPADAPVLVARASPGLRAALAAAGFAAQALREGRSAKDLAILARRRATLPLVAFALDRLGLTYVVSGRDLYGTPEVRDVFAALRLSQAPRDRHALATLARSPFGGLSDQALVDVSEPGRGLLPVNEWVGARLDDTQRERAELFQNRLSAYLQVAPRLSPRDAIHEVVRRFELESLFSLLPRGHVRLANVGRLQEIAAQHGGNLAAFVRWLTRQLELEQDETEAAVFSQEDDAIRLLTIHGSKGLAFPTVILADADAVEGAATLPVALLRRAGKLPALVARHNSAEGPIPTELQHELAVDLRARASAERQRLSYVALTRARSELVIALPREARKNTLAKTVEALRAGGAFGGIDGYRELELSKLLAEAPSALAAPIAPPREPPPLPTAARPVDVVLGVTSLSSFCVCPRRFNLIELCGIEEPTRGNAGGRAATLDLDPRRAGTAAHRVLELWPLESWGKPASESELSRLLAEGDLDPNSPGGRETLSGLKRFLEGSYAARVRERAARVERELELTVVLGGPAPPRPLPVRPERARAHRPKPLQLDLFAPAAPAEAAPPPPPPPRAPAPLNMAADGALVVKATLDLLVEMKDGSLDVLDYKRTRGGDSARYAPQLALYRSAVAARFGRVPRVGLLHLLGDAEEPEWLEPTLEDPLTIARDFAAARARGRWDPAPISTCEAIHCGFVSSCYSGHVEQ